MARLQLRDVRTHHVGPLSLALEAGECLALWGPSGSGKTLLLRAIADLDPHSGEVLLDDSAQEASSGPDWRRRVGYLAAESGWWAPAVGDHFPVAEERLRPDLDALRMPVGCFEWQVERLSTGERQRLALIRALLLNPAAYRKEDADCVKHFWCRGTFAVEQCLPNVADLGGG